MLRWFWQANTHEQSLYFVITFFIELIGRSCCFVLFATHEGAVPALHSSKRKFIKLAAGKALEDSQKENRIDYIKKSRISSMQMIRIV